MSLHRLHAAFWSVTAKTKEFVQRLDMEVHRNRHDPLTIDCYKFEYMYKHMFIYIGLLFFVVILFGMYPVMFVLEGQASKQQAERERERESENPGSLSSRVSRTRECVHWFAVPTFES